MAMLKIYIVVIFVILFLRNRLTHLPYIMHLGSLYMERRNFGTKLNKCTRTLQTDAGTFKSHCVLRCAADFNGNASVCLSSVIE